MKLNDVILEAASPAQQAAIAISMKKAGKKPKQGVAEGSKESYMIIRTDSEGKKDVFAGNFDTYEQAQKELDGLLDHPLHTKYKQKFEIKRKGGEQGVAEEASPMIKPPANRFDNKQEAFAYAKEHGGKVFKSTYIDPNTGIKNIIFVVKKEQGVAEDAVSDFIARGGQIQQGKLHKPRKGETWQGSSHIGAAGGRGTKGTVSGKAANTNPKGGKPVVSAEGYNPEYDDEAGMADNNLETLQRAVEGIDDLIQSGDNLPEWCQEKIAVAKSMLVAVWDYMYSEEASDEVDPEVDEMFEAMQELVAEMAVKNRVSEDLVWEQFEAMPDNVLYETAAWRRKEGKSKKGGLNAKGVASYRRENPGSKLQMAVTTKPSKLKKGSKASKRRKSFCARMSGVKGPMKKPNGKPTRKALALRKWNC